MEKPIELTYNYSNILTKEPKYEKLAIVVEHHENEDLIVQNWDEIYDTFLIELQKFDQAVVNMITLIKFVTEDYGESLFPQKYFPSTSMLVASDSAACILNDLCREVATKTKTFEESHHILGEKYLTKIILNIEKITKNKNVNEDLESQDKKMCEHCLPAVENSSNTKRYNGTSAKVEIVRHVFKNMRPSLLSVIKFFESIQLLIEMATNETFDKINLMSATFNFTLCCGYVSYHDFEFMSEMKIFEYSREISNPFEYNDIFLKNIISQFAPQLTDFQNDYKFLVLERLCCLELNIEEKYPRIFKALDLSIEKKLILPDWIRKTRSCESLEEMDEFSFKRAIIGCVESTIHPISPYGFNIRRHHFSFPYGIHLDFTFLVSPMKMENFDMFEAFNPEFSIGIFCCDHEGKYITGPHYRSNRRARIHIDLLCIRKQRHYYFAWIKNIARLFGAVLKSTGRDKLFYCDFYEAFETVEALLAHKCKGHVANTDESIENLNY